MALHGLQAAAAQAGSHKGRLALLVLGSHRGCSLQCGSCQRGILALLPQHLLQRRRPVRLQNIGLQLAAAAQQHCHRVQDAQLLGGRTGTWSR